MSTKFTIDEDEGGEMGKRLADFDEMNQPSFTSVTKLWKLVVVLIIIIVILFFTSLIICVTNDQCRNHIPTVNNMLNSTFTTPFVVSGMNAALGLHLVTATGLYYLTESKFPYWSYLQLFFAAAIYLSIIVTMMVFPFTGWQINWANVGIIVSLWLWMLIVLVSLFRHYRARTSPKQSLVKWNGVALLFFVVCSFIYLVLRGIPQLDVIPKDDGILVVEIVGGISFFAFMILCGIHVGGLEIQIRVN